MVAKTVNSTTREPRVVARTYNPEARRAPTRTRVRDHRDLATRRPTTRVRAQSATSRRADSIFNTPGLTIQTILLRVFALIARAMDDRIKKKAQELTDAKESGKSQGGKSVEVLAEELKELQRVRKSLLETLNGVLDSLQRTIDGIIRTLGQG